MSNLKRRIVWDRGGVSEVIGTILTLSITVVLFSSIILMVNQFPAPGDNVYTDFTATIEPWNNWTTGAYIHITNTGGLVMTDEWALIVITIDSETYSLDTKGEMDELKYGLGPEVPGHRGYDNGDANWDTGERWTFPRNATDIKQDSAVSAIILDKGKNALVWSAKIQGAGNRFGPIISNIRADSDLDSIRLDPIQFGRTFYIFADIYDPDGDLDYASVSVDLSSITLSPTIAMYHMGNGVFRSDSLMAPNAGTVPIGYHIAIVHAFDDDTPVMHSRAAGRIAVGLDLKGQPNLVINERNMRISTEMPTNHQAVSLIVTVMNYGGWCNGTLALFDIIDPVANPNGKEISNQSFIISDGPDQVTRTIAWEISPGGKHILKIVALPVLAVDADPSDNIGYINLTVMPTILLVDDDNQGTDFSPKDTASYMKGALDSCDFKYDVYTVGSGKDGPRYNTSDKKMTDYDVIIWMTGYETESLLTSADRQNLEYFLTDEMNIGKAGSLWLIGQYLLNDSASADFFNHQIKVIGKFGSLDGPGSELKGIAGNPVSNEWNSTTIPLHNMTKWLPDHKFSWEILVDSVAEVTFNQNLMDPAYGHALNYENEALDSRIVFFPWEFSRIEDTSNQAQVAYKVLNWLGNVNIRTGNDLAVSEQTLEPPFVFFNQKVTVTAVIRNNGPDDLDTQAGLFINGGNEPIVWNGTVSVPGNGGTATVTGTWAADRLGTHTLKWRVDPNNLIQETNEFNNEVPSHVHSGEVFVEFRILVVDDDSSDNNGGGFVNDTALLTESLMRLGYKFESDGVENAPFVVDEDRGGPSIDYLKNYSAVFWVCGNSTAGLNDTEAENLRSYLLNYSGRLWLSGDDLFNYTGLSPENRSLFLDVLGISNVTYNQGVYGTLRGLDNSPISHGMNISIANNPFVDVLRPNVTVGASGVLYQSYVAKAFAAVMHNSSGYHAIAFGFSLGTLNGTDRKYVAGSNATDELTFMLLRWMGRPETRNELRITERDYFLNDWHPQIGNAYVLRARVHNVGSNQANFLVRFMDGDVQIGSDTISVSPGAMTSAEIIWRPLFAGLRNINVFADPVGDVDEVFQWFNNNISFQIYVYFFWDDMESGSGKWTHSSTIININGEGPLDYYSPLTTVHTGISQGWNQTLSYGVETVTKTAYSYPNSFYMKEYIGMFGSADVLISFALDDSKSMSQRYASGNQTWLDAAKDAALLLLKELSDDSVCVSIWDSQGNQERRWAGPNDRPLSTFEKIASKNVRPPLRLGDPYTFPNGTVATNRERIREEIMPMDAEGGTTILWDGIGGAYLDTLYYNSTYPTLMPVVIVLSDGADTQASDQASIAVNRIEGGSDYWCPWNHVNDTRDYGDNSKSLHYGKYTMDWANPVSTTFWMETGLLGAMGYTNRRGLLYADMKIFTIGLGLEHHGNPWDPVVYKYPGNPADPGYLAPDANLFARYNPTQAPYGPFYVTDPHIYNESGTLEYNLWRIANTSGGMYFHAPSGDDLADIFTEIGMFLATGFNQTRSSSPAPDTRATIVKNSDKRAVTEPFSLVDMESAKLSFWHKYNMLQGGNGGILQVGYKTSAAGDWRFRYVTPPGEYTGMLYYPKVWKDDFNQTIKWCWNGVSSNGAYGWDHVNFDISPFVPDGFNATDNHVYRSEVVIAFTYLQNGGGTGVGWYIDDVKLDVAREESADITQDTKDLWKLTNLTTSGVGAHSGHHAWSNLNHTGQLNPGVDNSLVTLPIDLTSAKNAELSAYFKFNFNTLDGAPPDGFRVEVSSDGGMRWTAINLGVRSGEGVSGVETGINEGNYWVSSSTMSRLKTDLNAWVGNQIIIRFRMVTTDQLGYDHYSDPNQFFGFYVDDVEVTGDSIYG
ncbi:MAG: CARDB domain-containing protein [Thermoplasmata archaeon]